MGHSKKKKHDSSSESSSSSDSESYDESKNKKEDKKTRKSSSGSEDSEPKHKHKKNSQKAEKINKDQLDRQKKRKFEEAQKSKWDSPAENFKNDRKRDKDTRNNRSSNRDDVREKKYDRPDRRYDKREEYRNRERGSFNKYENRDRDNRNRDRYYKDDDKHRTQYHKNRDRSRSKEDERNDRRDNPRNRRQRRDSQDQNNYEWGRKTGEESKKPPVEKEKPNFGLSGKLTEDTNTFRGVVIKYSEPPEARKPKRRWRLYPFKGEKALPTLYIHRESAYLMGRDRKIVDFPLDHPSCSKQHAVLQYRLVPFTRDDGSAGKRVRPYLIDLESANGTFINNKKIEGRKYYELLEKDVIKFGYSSREYVLLHENSKDEGLDDDVKPEDEDVPVKEEPAG